MFEPRCINRSHFGTSYLKNISLLNYFTHQTINIMDRNPIKDQLNQSIHD
ncbi:hypothetical protein ACAN107058_11760 [Paracidovorax anthurii]|uniref:Uncharacterized protein n=1 Tax=Paracidovorax anthurii TaxID=78229 RepID=A0A328Y9M7_9BURK|nr:hypothetical protein AX018_11135 [Paracidovorax anthurii]